MERVASEELPEESHRNFPASRRFNRIEVDAVANGKWDVLNHQGPYTHKCFAHAFSLKENAQGPETLNTRAVAVVTRVSNKLTGRDFNPRVTLDVRTQVDKLIQQATSLENLCQCYIGWLVYSHRSFISPISQSLTLLSYFQTGVHFGRRSRRKASFVIGSKCERDIFFPRKSKEKSKQ